MFENYHNAFDETTQILLDAMLENDAPIRLSGKGFDRQIFTMLMQLGRQLSEKLLDEMGRRLSKEMSSKTLKIDRKPMVKFTTLFGKISLHSPYLYDRKTGESARPLKALFGVQGNRVSEAVQRAMTDFGSDKSFSGASNSMEEHYGLELDRSSIADQTLKLGVDAMEYVEKCLKDGQGNYMNAKSSDVLLVELDGCMLPVGEFKTAKEAGRLDLPSDKMVRVDTWVEARTGFARKIDEVEKIYVCQNAKYEVICEQLFGAACMKNLGQKTRVLAPGDGGHGLREGLENVFRNVEFRLDPTHLKDNFFACAEALEIKQPERTTWVNFHLDLIWKGELTEAIGWLKKQQKKKAKLTNLAHYHALRKLLNYIDRFSDCMDYPAYKKEGTPMGSGEVESAHKSVPQARLKIPGAKWRKDHLNPMLALRVIRANGWWNDFWECENMKQAS